MNLARLNHILLPSTKTGRDRFRTGWMGAVARPAIRFYRMLSEEGRFLVVFALIAGAFGLEVRLYQIYWLWSLATGMLIASILFRRFFALSDVRVTVDHPERVGLGDTLTIGLTLENHGERAHRGIRVEGPLLPWDGAYAKDAPSIRELAPHGSSRVGLDLSFSQRGEHHLDPIHVSALVPLGLAVGPSIATKGPRFLVLPRLAEIARFDSATGVKHQPGGVALASHTGEAREIVGLRPYRPKDPIRDLHHRAWAKRGVPVVREYQQEYFTRFGVVLDTATADEPRLEAAISLAGGILAHLSRGEALIDLMVVGNELHRLTLGRSLGFLEQGLDLLALVSPSERFDGQRIASVLSPHLDRLSSVVIIALEWDADRRSVAELVRRRGVGCRALLVGGSSTEGVTGVELEAIGKGGLVL